MCFGLPLFCHFVCIPLFLECDWEKLARSIGLCIRLYVLSFLKYWPWPWHFIMPRIRTHSIHWLSYTHCQHTIKTIISPFVHSSSWSRRAVAAVGMFCVSFYPIHSISIPFQSNPYHILLYIDGLQIHTTFAFIQHSISNVQWFLFIYRSKRNKKNVQKLKEKKKIFQQTGKWRAFVWLDAHCIYISQHMDIQHDGCRESISLCAYSSNCIFLQLQWNSIEIGMRWHFNRQAAWLLPGIGPIFIV